MIEALADSRWATQAILNEQIKQRGKFLSEKETEVDETYFGPTRVKGKRGRSIKEEVSCNEKEGIYQAGG